MGKRFFAVHEPVIPVATIGPRPLYVFFDEAGDLDFGKSGSRYFLCCMLVTYDPWPLMQTLTDLREEIFRGGFIPRAFHAAEDRQEVRDAVFRTIVGVGGFDAHTFSTEKGRVPTKFRDSAAFYSLMADYALRMVLQRHPTDDPIYVTTDELPTGKKREAIVKGLKASLAAILPGREFRIEHHPSGTQGGLQATDYVAWAAFRRRERLDSRSYDLIKDYIVQEGELDGSLLR